DLNEHIEKVTQMYLRNEYESLAEYNAQAGRLAEKYQFLVIADFPVNFTDIAVKRLQSIAASGPRCGVYLLIHWDQRKPAPVEFVPEELRKNAICIVPKGEGFMLAQANWDGTKLSLDAPPDAELATKLLMQIGKDSTDSYRVEMPFAEVAPDEREMWSLNTTSELRVPVGRTGATKLQYLALGQGTRQHGLIAGKTGSGKSTLFHVIITNLALWCSPDQVEFYLVDFKKGVEFKCYATHKLPHARVIAIESDREFGLSVLQRVDEELKRRGDLFRKLGAQDIAGYKRAGGKEPMPRVLLLIDEFQELFVEDDRISQGAALLLDRIVRQGRAFGIHVLLGSQTLGGAYTLARATMGQMVVRVALQCNEADAYLIMNEDNPAPRLLSRPGEAIYNDDGGAIQGNSPFQVVWLPDQTRDEWLAKVRDFAERHAGVQALACPPDRLKPELQREPIVFEGNAPANVRDNPVLRAFLDAKTIHPTSTPRVFLGAPNSIKCPTEAVFRRASGSHLLVVGQREEAALGMLAVALVALAAQHPKNAARFLVFDCSPPDSAEAKFLEHAVRVIPHEVKLVRPGEVDDVMTTLAAEQQQRTDATGATGPETYLLIHGLQRNKKLRFDEEMSFSLDADGAANPGLQLNKLICEGAGLGFHVIATCDTYNNVMRMVSRKALSEFEMRVVFQMSANDSASLIDSPQANNLGLHRAILFNGHEGWLETFRPYALPEETWLDEVGQRLARLHG
ncbi:MAG: ATP-binding protein, partial [Verrucomicrobia bacterium]|nr:ATP-binding protein [Verrucomicrobiota bacterium]